MNATEIYSHCQTAAGGLLSAIDSRDLPNIEDELGRLRGYLSTRDETVGNRTDWLCEEKLDAIEGVAEELALSIRSIRRAPRVFRRVQETAPLLRHLTAG